jgi:predicted porin
MRQKLIAIAVLAAVSGIAQAADNVTIYGVIDGGISYTNKSPTTGTNTGSLLGFQSNGESPSIFGLKGSEDLGGGLKANMDLEGHFLPGTGVANQWGGLFGRQANVGLSGSFGTVTLGNQYSPAVLAFATTDPRGLKESFSGLMTWAFSETPVQGGGSTGLVNGTPGYAYNSNSVIDVFVKNAISYSVQMPMGWMSSTDGLNISALYAFGGIAGSTQANRVISLGVSYSSPLLLSLAYQTQNGDLSTASGTANTKFSVGAGYAFGMVTVKVNYMDDKGKNAGTGAEITHYKVTGVGADFKLNDSDTVTLAYYDGKNSDANDDTAKSIILSNDYFLSKRTTLYALIAQVKGGDNVSGGSSAYNGDNFSAPPVAGQTAMALQFGVKHAF